MRLIQRVIESEGMATISVCLSEQITRKVRPSREFYPGFPRGYPIGYPGRTQRQLNLLRLLLKQLEKLDFPGSLVK